MSFVTITLCATLSSGEFDHCPAKLDTKTFEVLVEDASFTEAAEGSFEAVHITHEYLCGSQIPVAVDYSPTGNEFMVTDADDVDLIIDTFPDDMDEDTGDYDDDDEGSDSF